jgi:hypothetical protein
MVYLFVAAQLNTDVFFTTYCVFHRYRIPSGITAPTGTLSNAPYKNPVGGDCFSSFLLLFLYFFFYFAVRCFYLPVILLERHEVRARTQILSVFLILLLFFPMEELDALY